MTNSHTLSFIAHLLIPQNFALRCLRMIHYKQYLLQPTASVVCYDIHIYTYIQICINTFTYTDGSIVSML